MPKMHADEVDIDAALVERLVAEQFPRWASLPITTVEPWGTDNAIYRLGGDLCVRLPRIERAVETLEQERRTLRSLPPLPLAVPEPVADGTPGAGYPWTWSVYRWLEGEPATSAGEELAEFLLALQRVDAAGGQPPHPGSGARGAPLAPRDALFREAVEELSADADTERMLAIWEGVLRVPEWNGDPVWFHGDLDGRNVLGRDGRLVAVLDWGCAGVGDPAVDVMAAWKLFSAESRPRFREALGVDAATWERARGWALSQSVMALGYYTLENNPALVLEAKRWLTEVLGDPVSDAATMPSGRRPFFP
jgi:aminoglycoside phosphotransferase (APT) family kinase protein